MWTEELAALLGKIPDSQIARKAGVDRDTVAEERRRRGIEACRPRQSIEWTPALIAAIGTESDRKLARELGLTRSAVKHKRECLGIPAFHPPPYEPVRCFLWEPEDLALLGKMPDTQVAERLGISVGAVARKRRQLKIPPFLPQAPLVAWTPEMLELLGKIPDPQMAQLFGISHGTVARKRRRLGIPGHLVSGKVVPTPELIELLRHYDSVEVRRRTGLSRHTIRHLRAQLGLPAPEVWTPEAFARLGREPDRCIAPDVGLTPSGVRQRRLALGIPAFCRQRPWQAEELAILGTAPDEVISQRLGRSLDSVRRKRRKLRRPQVRLSAGQPAGNPIA